MDPYWRLPIIVFQILSPHGFDVQYGLSPFGLKNGEILPVREVTGRQILCRTLILGIYSGIGSRLIDLQGQQGRAEDSSSSQIGFQAQVAIGLVISTHPGGDWHHDIGI